MLRKYDELLKDFLDNATIISGILIQNELVQFVAYVMFDDIKKDPTCKIHLKDA